jgi:hypothetical protein
MPSDGNQPPEIAGLDADSVLYDRHRKEYFHVTAVDGEGVGLHQSGTEFYVPHSLYVTWQGTRLVPRTQLSDPDIPEWLTARL